ncbi:MAG: signal peptidase II [Tissierellia bacterium]|nr:signal peptidase II [Tissierellia bacterium]
MLTIIIAVLAFGFDQLTKFLAVKLLKGNQAFVIIDNFLSFAYVENRGAAFGILQNKKILFVVVTLVVLIIVVSFLHKNYNTVGKWLKVSLGLLVGGTLGNFLDRIRLDYVVDFISVRLFNKFDFAVFNVADICIVIGTIMLMIYIILSESKEINE